MIHHYSHFHETHPIPPYYAPRSLELFSLSLVRASSTAFAYPDNSLLSQLGAFATEDQSLNFKDWAPIWKLRYQLELMRFWKGKDCSWNDSSEMELSGWALLVLKHKHADNLLWLSSNRREPHPTSTTNQTPIFLKPVKEPSSRT